MAPYDGVRSLGPPGLDCRSYVKLGLGKGKIVKWRSVKDKG
jgi:hypothetical protein